MINDDATSCLTFAERSNLGIFSFDVELMEFTYVNRAFKKYDLLAGNSLKHVDINELIHPEDVALAEEAYKELLQDENIKNAEVRIVFPYKTIRTFRIEASKFSTSDKRRVIVGSIQDITSFKEHSETLNKFSNKKNSLLNILSHDLLGPLGTIQNLSAIIKKKMMDSETKEITEFINSIDKISKRGVAMIRNLLNQEFLESASAELVVQRKNIVPVVRETIEEYKQSKEVLQRTFTFSANKDIILVDIDEAKLLQAINNLVSNALKFTKENGIINISIKEEDNSVLLCISDNGIGIPERHQASLFDKFTSARRPGLHGEVSHGLGMSIIKTIIELHHGQIWFESKENEGTTFYIRLPSQRAAVDPK